jgi:hypothetical protein
MEEQEGREEAHTGEVQGCQFHACNEKGGPERRYIQEEGDVRQMAMAYVQTAEQAARYRLI